MRLMYRIKTYNIYPTFFIWIIISINNNATIKSDIVVVMEKCWGTPVADRENSMRYYMIQDGCPVRGDTSLNIRSNGQSLQGKFDIKMFKFIGDDLNDVWLHCTVHGSAIRDPGIQSSKF